MVICNPKLMDIWALQFVSQFKCSVQQVSFEVTKCIILNIEHSIQTLTIAYVLKPRVTILYVYLHTYHLIIFSINTNFKEYCPHILE